MKILYLTNAIRQDHYEDFQKLWSRPLNCSNQLFHSRLIHTLSLTHEVHVFSFRPLNKNCSKKRLESEEYIDKNITWNYFKVTKHKLTNLISSSKEFSRCFSKFYDVDLVLFDSMNLFLGYLASKLKNEGYKVLPICTDLPQNISGVNTSYVSLVYKNTSDVDGYITLSEGLNDCFNKDNKPYVLINGVLSESDSSKEEISYKNYFLFSGALMEKYGLYACIDAFIKLNNPETKLILCGHHGNIDYLKNYIKDYKNIIFLGYIPNDLVRKYEANSIANICPRPLNNDIDLYSIPSKCIEYLSSGSLLISTKNPLLKPLFEKCVLWTDENSDSIKEQMERAISMSDKEKAAFTKTAIDTVNKLYSPIEINKKLSELFSTITK